MHMRRCRPCSLRLKRFARSIFLEGAIPSGVSVTFSLRPRVKISLRPRVRIAFVAMGKKQAPTKRQAGSTGSSPSSKHARVSLPPSSADLGTVVKGSSSKAKLVPDKAPIQLSVMPYNTSGSIYGPPFTEGPLCVMHFVHDARPSVVFQFFKFFSDFLGYRWQEDAEFPQTRNEVEAAFGIKFVATRGDPNVVETHGLFKPWRIGIFMNTDAVAVSEVVILLDAYVRWRCAGGTGDDAMSKDQELHIEVPASLEMTLDPNDMECKYTLYGVEDDGFSFKITDVPPPCYPARLMCATIETSSENTISIVWNGNVYPFKAAFMALGIGGKEALNEHGAREYFRKVDNVPYVGEEALNDAMKFFGRDLTREAPTVVQVRNLPQKDTHFQELLARIRALPNVVLV